MTDTPIGSSTDDSAVKSSADAAYLDDDSRYAQLRNASQGDDFGSFLGSIMLWLLAFILGLVLASFIVPFLNQYGTAIWHWLFP